MYFLSAFKTLLTAMLLFGSASTVYAQTCAAPQNLTFSRLVEDTSSGTTTGDSSTLATYGQQTDWSHEFVSTITNSGGTAYGELRIRRGTVSGISGRITNSAINTSTNLLDIATQGSRVPDGWDFYDIRIVSNTGYQIDGSNLDYHVMSANSALVSTRWNDADRISFDSVSGTMSSNFTLITEGNFTTPRVANIPELDVGDAALVGSIYSLADPTLQITRGEAPFAEFRTSFGTLSDGTEAGMLVALRNGAAAEYFALDSVLTGCLAPPSEANLVTAKVLASGSSSTPAEGDTVTYQITVTNNGPAQATNVSLTDSLPAGLTAASGNGTVSQGTYTAGTGVWNVGTLNNGASATLTLSGTVNTGQAGNTITNTTTAATSSQTDPTTTGDDLTESVVVAIRSLGISKSQTLNADEDGSSSITVGDTLTYRVVATNTGTATLTNVVVSDAKISPNSVTCATLAPSATCTLTGTHVVTTAEANAGKVENTGSVTSTEVPGPTTTAPVVTTVTPTIKPVTESGTGTTTVASVVIANVRANDTINGAAATTSNSTIAISGSWPSGFSLNTTSGAISIDSTVAPGSYNLTYQLCDLKSPANCATVQDQVTVNNVTADLGIAKDNGTNTLTYGQTATYAIVVTNQGPGTVTGAVVKDAVGSGLTCAPTNSVVITGNGVPAGSFTINDLTSTGITLATLTSGQAATLTYSCTVN